MTVSSQYNTICVLWYVRYAMTTCHMVHIIISCLLQACQIPSNQILSLVALSTVTASDRCQCCVLAPSTGHMLNSCTSALSVLQGDMGGERVLQKKWTTFLKAQLLCSLPDDGFPFNIIQDMFVLKPMGDSWESTVFYGVFTSQW